MDKSKIFYCLSWLETRDTGLHRNMSLRGGGKRGHATFLSVSIYMLSH